MLSSRGGPCAGGGQSQAPVSATFVATLSPGTDLSSGHFQVLKISLFSMRTLASFCLKRQVVLNAHSPKFSSVESVQRLQSLLSADAVLHRRSRAELRLRASSGHAVSFHSNRYYSAL